MIQADKLMLNRLSNTVICGMIYDHRNFTARRSSGLKRH